MEYDANEIIFHASQLQILITNLDLYDFGIIRKRFSRAFQWRQNHENLICTGEEALKTNYLGCTILGLPIVPTLSYYLDHPCKIWYH